MSQNKIKLYQIDQSGAIGGQLLSFNANNNVWEPVTVTIPTLAGFATETYVNSAIGNLVASAPQTLDTLNELATALGNDANFSSTITTALGNRLRIDTNTQNLTATEKANARTNLGLATVATTGSYTDLTNIPNLANVTISGDYNDLTNKPALANVAISGNYTDLNNKPTTVSGYGITDAVTLTGQQTLSNKTLTAPTVNSPKVKGEQAAATNLGVLTSGTTAIDLSTAQIFAATIATSATVTFDFSNLPSANHSQVIMLQLTNGGSGTVAWPSGTKFSGGTAPALTASGIDLLGIFYNSFLNGYVVFLLGKDIK